MAVEKKESVLLNRFPNPRIRNAYFEARGSVSWFVHWTTFQWEAANASEIFEAGYYPEGHFFQDDTWGISWLDTEVRSSSLFFCVPMGWLVSQRSDAFVFFFVHFPLMSVLRCSGTFAHYLLCCLIILDRYYVPVPQIKKLATCSNNLFHLLWPLFEKIVCMQMDAYFAEEEMKNVCGESFNSSLSLRRKVWFMGPRHERKFLHFHLPLKQKKPFERLQRDIYTLQHPLLLSVLPNNSPPLSADSNLIVLSNLKSAIGRDFI